MRPAGEWWDAIRVPRRVGETVLAALGTHSGAVIEDPSGGILYWLVRPHSATDWQFPTISEIHVRSDATHVAVPGTQCTAGPHWRVPPTRSRCLTDPELLRAAIQDAVDAAFGPRPEAAS